MNNKIQRIDSSIGEIISNLDNREQDEDVLEEYNLVLDSSNYLIKVFTPYNCEWNLEVLPATSDEILWSQHKDNIVHSFLVERFGDNYDDSLYIINIDNNSKTYIDKETNEMFLETIETSMEFIVKDYIDYTEYRINKEETINDEKKNPFNISSYFGISSTYVTYSIDNTLEQEYYKRDYILQLKCKNEIKKTIELYIENSYTDADYDIRLSDTVLPYSNGKTFIQIISPTEWRIQETVSSGFTNISPNYGAGSQNITLSYDNNDNITPRETTLELYSLPDEILRKSLKITQSAKPA